MRHGYTERSGGFLIDYEFYRRSLLNWQISWFFTLVDPSGVIADDAKRLGEASSVAKETACNSKLTKLINGGKSPGGTVLTVDYNFPKPGTTEPLPKQSFVTKVDNQGCGVGYYK